MKTLLKSRLRLQSLVATLGLISQLVKFSRGILPKRLIALALLSSMRSIFIPWDLPGFDSLPPHRSGRRRVAGVGYFEISNCDDVIQERLARGIPWEPHLILTERFISTLASRFGSYTILDVGANIGTFTIYAAKRADYVLAVEPNPEARELLLRSLALDSRIMNVEVSQSLLGEIEGQAAEVSLDVNNNLGAHRFKVLEGEPNSSEFRVERLDSIFRRRPNEFVLLKIDVEGMEQAVLSGSLDLLASKNLAILIEMWEGQESEVIEMLAAFGLVGIKLRRDDYLFVHPSVT